ncbi:MAG: hypothetical protein WC472_02060 [Candidatus Paceibacterota bacterium]
MNIIFEIVIGIPYHDPSGLVAGTLPPEIFETQVFLVGQGCNPRKVLERNVYPQHVWTHTGYDGKISERAIAYYVEQLGHTVSSELTEDILTKTEKEEIVKAKEVLQAVIATDAQQEFSL